MSEKRVGGGEGLTRVHLHICTAHGRRQYWPEDGVGAEAGRKGAKEGGDGWHCNTINDFKKEICASTLAHVLRETWLCQLLGCLHPWAPANSFYFLIGYLKEAPLLNFDWMKQQGRNAWTSFKNYLLFRESQKTKYCWLVPGTGRPMCRAKSTELEGRNMQVPIAEI